MFYDIHIAELVEKLTKVAKSAAKEAKRTYLKEEVSSSDGDDDEISCPKAKVLKSSGQS